MPDTLTDMQKMRRLPWSIGSSALNAVFGNLTFGSAVFVLFLNELGLPKTKIGVLLSLFPFCGVVAPVFAPVAMRLGLKRTFIAFWGLRKFVILLLLLSPWILSEFGPRATFAFVTGVILTFAICRALAETAWCAWEQEYVPNSVRGRYGAIANIVCGLAGILALVLARIAIDRLSGLGRFLLLIAIGGVAGILAVVLAAFIPGGEPVPAGRARAGHLRQIAHALRDRNFMLLLAGASCSGLAVTALSSFIPLFMTERIGLAAGSVVMLEQARMAGSLVSSFLWGWAADRYGSRPVLQCGLGITTVLPLAWMLLPANHPWTQAAAVACAVVFGVGTVGSGIGTGLMLYNRVVPTERKASYLSVWYAWTGIVTGIGPLLGGALLDSLSGMDRQFGFLRVHAYTPFLVAAGALLAVSMLWMRRVSVAGDLPTREFLGMFLTGNPFTGVGAILRHGLAGDEDQRLSVTQQMGEARSPLTLRELLDALDDPSFNVRYEAIIAAARSKPSQELVAALVHILGEPDPELQPAAAWALGRIEAAGAIAPLREAMNSPFPAVAARSARSLAMIGDRALIPLFRERMNGSAPAGVRIAYASALGMLRATEALPDLLRFLRDPGEDDHVRREAALAVARLFGGEATFVRFSRQEREADGTPLAQGALGLRRRIREIAAEDSPAPSLFDRCVDQLARNRRDEAARSLAAVLRLLPASSLSPEVRSAFGECAARLETSGAGRPEYLVLVLHVLDAAEPADAAQPPAPSSTAEGSTATP